jgi:predicted Rossmann-fold nucleotide-binding protein
VLLNQEGFYDDLLRLFETMVAKRFTKSATRDLFHVADNVDQIFDFIESAPVVAETQWFETV